MILWDIMLSERNEFSLLITYSLQGQENSNLCDQLSYKLERGDHFRSPRGGRRTLLLAFLLVYMYYFRALYRVENILFGV